MPMLVLGGIGEDDFARPVIGWFPRRDVNCCQVRRPHVHISITDPGSEPVVFHCGKPVLPLEFHDLGPECPAQLADKLMTTTQAKKIAKFLFTKKPEAIIVNCEAGISRSAGVAAALAKFFHDDDKEIFKKAIPNTYVYRLTLDAMTQKKAPLRS